MANFIQGLFKPKNPEKYIGRVDQIVYRSSWELQVMTKLDEHPDIIKWQSEETAIPYKSPIDNRYHRYFPDFIIKKKGAGSKLETMMIEVKPAKQTVPPKPAANKKSRKYITEVTTYAVNEAKWAAARRFCEERNWQFVLITENDLKIPEWKVKGKK